MGLDPWVWHTSGDPLRRRRGGWPREPPAPGGRWGRPRAVAEGSGGPRQVRRGSGWYPAKKKGLEVECKPRKQDLGFEITRAGLGSPIMISPSTASRPDLNFADVLNDGDSIYFIGKKLQHEFLTYQCRFEKPWDSDNHMENMCIVLDFFGGGCQLNINDPPLF